MKHYNKNIYLSFIILFSVVNRGYTQHTEPTLLKVIYNYKHVFDTTNKNIFSSTEEILRIGKFNSKYNNLKLENTQQHSSKNNNSLNTAMNLNVKTIAGSPIVVVTSRQLNNEIIYQLPTENQLIEIDRIGFQDYKIQSDFNKIKWDIYQDTKIINGYHCQKAIGEFGGRTYLVWFSPELPYKYGPWKLCGLPGLILEARDSTNTVLFELYKISFVDISSTDYIVYDAIRPITIDTKTYKKAVKQYNKDPIIYSIAQLKDNVTVTQISFIDENGKMISGEDARKAIKKEQNKVVNNPIEF
jgi:GLPGLI family protein